MTHCMLAVSLLVLPCYKKPTFSTKSVDGISAPGITCNHWIIWCGTAGWTMGNNDMYRMCRLGSLVVGEYKGCWGRERVFSIVYVDHQPNLVIGWFILSIKLLF